MDTPEQCRTCRHMFLEEDEARCHKIMMQHCERKGELQKLLMKPGHCRLINPNNDCADYAKQWFKK